MFVSNSSYSSVRARTFIPENRVVSSFVRQKSYELRLCAEIDDCYKNNGVCIFLTFTYNNENLPSVSFTSPLSGRHLSCSCFNRLHVKKFLNQLKVSCFRSLPSLEYKYFFCFEYGSDTKRPHYHALFFLSDPCYVSSFVEICRSKWSYGFTFPAPGVHCDERAVLRSKKSAASYAAKYVCKDLSFFALPCVSALEDYVKTLDVDSNEYKKYINCFPRIYQSNGIGASLCSQFVNKFDDVCRYGLYNPLTKKYSPVPAYCLNKFFYKNIKALDGRFGKNGKILYDRELKVDVEYFILYRLIRLSCRSASDSYLYDAENTPICFPGFKNSLAYVKKYLNTSSLALPVAIYRDYIRCASSRMFSYCDSIETLFSVDFVKSFLKKSVDVRACFLNDVFFDDSSCYLSSMLPRELVFHLEMIIVCVQRYKEDLLVASIQKSEDDYNRHRAMSIKIYPTSLC